MPKEIREKWTLYQNVKYRRAARATGSRWAPAETLAWNRGFPFRRGRMTCSRPRRRPSGTIAPRDACVVQATVGGGSRATTGCLPPPGHPIPAVGLGGAVVTRQGHRCRTTQAVRRENIDGQPRAAERRAPSGGGLPA